MYALVAKPSLLVKRDGEAVGESWLSASLCMWNTPYRVWGWQVGWRQLLPVPFMPGLPASFAALWEHPGIVCVRVSRLFPCPLPKHAQCYNLTRACSPRPSWSVCISRVCLIPGKLDLVRSFGGSSLRLVTPLVFSGEGRDITAGMAAKVMVVSDLGGETVCGP